MAKNAEIQKQRPDTVQRPRPAASDIHTRRAMRFLVRSRLPRRIAPDYAAASCTPRPPRRLLLTESAAPPHHAMRPRSPRERLTPLGLAPPAYSRSQVQPLPSRKPRDASAAAHSPPLSRATALPLFWQESDPLSLARQSPPGSSPSAEDARERAGGLVSTLTPRRVARRRGSPLSGHLVA